MTKARFFNRESLFQPKFARHDVADETLNFYPLSVNMLWKMRTAVEPIAEALRVLSGGKNDYEQTVDQGIDEETGERRVVTHIGAVKPEIAKLRADRLDASIKGAFDAFFAPSFREFVGEMIADSLRDDFTRAQAKDKGTIQLMMDGDESGDNPGLDVGTLGEMVAGLVKANMKVFGPFGKRVQEMMSEKMNHLVSGPSEHGSEATSDSLESSDLETLESDESVSDPMPLDPQQTQVG